MPVASSGTMRQSLARVNEFCTSFDRHYLPRALALHASLKRHCPDFRLNALCLDDVAFETMRGLALASVELTSLPAFEAANPDVAAVKHERDVLDYYLTLTPAWILHVVERCGQGDLLTYLDADIYLFSSPQPLFSEMTAKSAALAPHHYSAGLSEAAGRFNSGLMVLRNDPVACRLIRQWRSQCLEWCEYRFDDGRYGDQAYLDAWQHETGVHEFQHPGSHYGPWSVADIQTGRDAEGNVLVQDCRLVAFHFSKLSKVNQFVYEAGFTYFGAKASRMTRELVYRPYVEELDRSYRRVRTSLSGPDRLSPPANLGWWQHLPFGLTLRSWARSLHHVWQGVVNRGYVWVWRGRAF
jgi:hypothetical protein